MKKLFTTSILLSIFFVMDATNYFVNGSVTASGDGTSWATAFKTIDEAVTAAANQDVIYIAAGDYTKAGAITISKVLTLKGGYAGIEDVTTASPDPVLHQVKVRSSSTGQGITISVTSDPGIPTAKHVFDGLYFYNSNAGGTGFGGGLYVDAYYNPIEIKNCFFEQNKAGKGGAIYFDIPSVSSQTALIDNCKFYDNGSSKNDNASGYGGGAIFANAGSTNTLSLTIQNSQFLKNYSYPEGGAIYLREGINFSTNNVLFKGNKVNPADATKGIGGAIYVYRKSTVTLTNSQFIGNVSSAKGNLFFNVATSGSNNISASMDNVIFAGNYAAGQNQSNIYVNNYDATTISTISNCVISNNTHFAGSKPELRDFWGPITATGKMTNYTLTNSIVNGKKVANSNMNAEFVNASGTIDNYTDYFNSVKIVISKDAVPTDSALVFVNTTENVNIPHYANPSDGVILKIKDGSNAYSLHAVTGTTASLEVVINVSGNYTIAVPAGYKVVDASDQTVTALSDAGTYQLTLKSDLTSVFPALNIANKPYMSSNKIHNLMVGDFVTVYNIQGVKVLEMRANSETVHIPSANFYIVKVKSNRGNFILK